jgi:hypothetical protein
MLPALLDEIDHRYGLTYSTLSNLLNLVRNFSRSRARKRAFILLTAPLAFHRFNGYLFYGNLTQDTRIDSGNLINNEKEGQTVGPTSLWESTPWAEIDDLALQGLAIVQEQVRKDFLLTQYDSVMESIKLWETLQSPITPGSRLDKTVKAPDFQHPFFKALAWLSGRFSTDYFKRLRVTGMEDHVFFRELDLRYCIDPTLRSYLDLKSNRSNISSHLTLKVYKILRGDQPMPSFTERRIARLTSLSQTIGDQPIQWDA